MDRCGHDVPNKLVRVFNLQSSEAQGRTGLVQGGVEAQMVWAFVLEVLAGCQIDICLTYFDIF